MTDLLISQFTETQLINKILKKRDKLLNCDNQFLIQSYQDDAALISNKDKYTVISTDMLIEDKHFPKGMTKKQMGKKIVCVNVSDILSMNAKADSIVVSMGLPETLTESEFDSLIDGILESCKDYNITLIGGDINASEKIILSATAIGFVNNNITFQNNIKPDQLVCITGKLGYPAAALDLINNPMDISNKDEIINTLLEPDLPIDFVNSLQSIPELNCSMTDITDGLAKELENLQKQNPDIGFIIYKDKIYDPTLDKIAKHYNKSVYEYLLHFGEEFELLVIIDENNYLEYKDKLDSLLIIGKTTNNKKICIKDENQIYDIELRGYQHFTGE